MIFEDYLFLTTYAVSSKEDTAYQRMNFTRKRVRVIPNTAYPSIYIRRNRLMKKGITMTELNEYISVTRKNLLSDDNKGRMIEKFFMEADEDDDPDDIAEIFKIEGNLFDYKTPLCKAFNDFNYLLKINTDLFTLDIQGIKTYEEYELNNNMMGDLEEPWSDNGVPYQLGELPGMVRVGCMTYFQDHKWYNVLANGKLKGPYANIKTEKTYDPYLDINRIFGRNYGADNVDDTQGCQERKEEHNKPIDSSKSTYDPSICQVGRFKMIKYLPLKNTSALTIQKPTLMHVKLIENFSTLWMKDGS
ncbi:hypothetical protein Tco_0535280 [Tanacetum coccineum]